MLHNWRYALTGMFVLVPFIAIGCGDDSRDFSGPGDGGESGTDASAGSGGDGGGTGSGGDGGSSGGGGASGSSDGGSGGEDGGGTGGSGGVSEDGGPSGTDAGVDASMDGGGDSGPTDCTTDEECDDGIECNGEETCEDGVCAAGTQVANGTECTPKFASVGDAGVPGDAGVVADAGTVRPTVCYNGGCSSSCETDDECDDGDPCTGREICLADEKVCISGTPLDCDDDNDCTEDTCEARVGCMNTLIDGDNDGHADEAIGECGDDCDDEDADVFAGAAELCDEKDNDCDGMTDEEAPVWYRDCDLDGYAPAGANSVQQCDAPAAADPQCGAAGGGWTTLAPKKAGESIDCWDLNPEARPGSTAWHPEAIPSGAMAPPLDEDWNCDGVEELLYTTVGSASNTCSRSCTELICSKLCTGSSTGWSYGPVPRCGASRSFYGCNFLTCASTVTTQTQQCR